MGIKKEVFKLGLSSLGGAAATKLFDGLVVRRGMMNCYDDINHEKLEFRNPFLNIGVDVLKAVVFCGVTSFAFDKITDIAALIDHTKVTIHAHAEEFKENIKKENIYG